MNDIQKPISILAVEARIYSENIANNMLKLGKVFAEAKAQVKHGEWEGWVQQNTGMSVRSAQQLMAVYQRFGERSAFAGLEKSKLYKMLSLPEGTEESFAEANNLKEMTSREVEEAVKRVRAEADAALRKEREARERAEEMLNRQEVPPEVCEELKAKSAVIEQQKQEIERVAAVGRESLAESTRLRGDINRLKRELDENAELLQETQNECNRAQTELLNLQSTMAKGDADRTPSDELTADAFASAVRQFIGACARMPHMRRRFAAMGHDEHREYDELLQTIEAWARDSRKALDTVEVQING